jgi:hypothetical protein
MRKAQKHFKWKKVKTRLNLLPFNILPGIKSSRPGHQWIEANDAQTVFLSSPPQQISVAGTAR